MEAIILIVLAMIIIYVFVVICLLAECTALIAEYVHFFGWVKSLNVVVVCLSLSWVVFPDSMYAMLRWLLV